MSIRRERQLTQEQFGSLFHVTRQTVSNWENGKSYPDLQLLVAISDQFGVSLDTLLKEDTKMVKAIEEGWAGESETPTHIVLQFDSSHGGAYIGSVGNTLWIDNLRLVY